MPLEYPEFTATRPVPPSINENVFAVPDDLQNDAVIGTVREALKVARIAAEKAHTIASATLNDETMTETARHARAADTIFRTTRPALEQVQTVIEKLDAKVKVMEETLRGPPEPASPVGHFQHMEVRNMLAGMNAKKRGETILKAIRTGDQLTIAAVMRCPAYLLGYDDDLAQQEFRRNWQQKYYPKETAYLEQLRTVAGHLERGGQLLLSYGLQLTSPVLVQRAKKAQERTAAAAA